MLAEVSWLALAERRNCDVLRQVMGTHEHSGSSVVHVFDAGVVSLERGEIGATCNEFEHLQQRKIKASSRWKKRLSA
jgi:hypothetical protein